MLVRICDKVITPQKKELITNIRRVNCTAVYDSERTSDELEGCTLQNVLLYIDPKTSKATVVEMWLANMEVIKDGP
jgi:hypothetical protein